MFCSRKFLVFVDFRQFRCRIPSIFTHLAGAGRKSQSFSSAANSNPQTNQRKMEGSVVNWDFTGLSKQDILDKAANLIERYNQAIEDVATTTVMSYEAVLLPLLDAERWSSDEGALLTFPKNVSDSKETRDASTEASIMLDEAQVEVSMRVDIFEKLLELELTVGSTLPYDQARALAKLIKNGRRNGLHLSPDSREEIKSIKNRINLLSTDFTKNLNEDNSNVLFTKEQLAGMPENFLEGLEKDANTGKYILDLKYPHVFPVTRKCRISETRKVMETAFNSRCKEENTMILEELLELRHREATILGFENHAAYVQDVLMAKNPISVRGFLMDLSTKLQPLWRIEKAMLLRMKEEECEEFRWEFVNRLEPWDSRYYTQRMEEEMFLVDQEQLKEYFPLDIVTEGLLGIYEQLLSLRFVLMDDAPVWHNEVSAYKVLDLATDDLMGYFFLDMHPREGKYGHNCCIPLQMSCLKPDGTNQPCVIAMICNFSRPQNGRPSLLDHNEVETYFHEFGHVMHSICSKVDIAMFSGACAVERDFLECPSQMLENWVWHKEPLLRMSKHYLTGEALPNDMIEKLMEARKANAGGSNLRQIALALFDQRIHSAGRCDTAAIYKQTLKEIVGMDVIPGTSMPATFTHLAGGYSGRYYSYLWSEVFSMDMFETKFGVENIMSADAGYLYRTRVLQPGGSLDANDLLRNFLDRPPRVDPFLRSKGISPTDDFS